MSALGTYHIYALSERAAVFSLGNTIDTIINDKILALHAWLGQHGFEGLKDLVPAYSSLTVLYDPFVIRFEAVKQKLEQAWAGAGEHFAHSRNTVSIPVCYDPVFGYDIEEMASTRGMSMAELVQLHCSKAYRVYMLGFLPGFAYMGSVNERLVTPRRSQPREVAAGSVGIAGAQTGIYPFNSPGGWQIIGRTPVKLFDAEQEPPVLLRAGDAVQFHPITLKEFEQYGAHYH